MTIGISEEHLELTAVARRFLETHCPPAVTRAAADAPHETLPPFWPALVEVGWLGLHVGGPGGQGYGLAELAVVLEQLGRACAPGPFLPTVAAIAAVDVGFHAGAHAGSSSGSSGDASRADAANLVAALVAGRPATLVTEAGLTAERRGDGWRVTGTLAAVTCGSIAEVLVAPVDVGGDERWAAIELASAEVVGRKSLDPTRRVASVTFGGAAGAAGAAVEMVELNGLDRRAAEALLAIMLATEACGVAQWCVDEAAAYAKVREQFGRPIGQFQGVKHRCAEMLARTELARAAAWDAARAWGDDGNGADTAIAAAAALATGVRDTAKDCVQTFGGIGFTWEHDAQLYMRRASAIHQLLGPARRWRRRVAQASLAGGRRTLDVELPPTADVHRAAVRQVLDELDPADDVAARRVLADGGWLAPSWPKPWGRDASAVEQLVIEEEFRRAKRRRPHLGVGAWALPTVIVYGDDAQQQRWIPPTLRGEISWCQLFSEPGAGSDLAALTTRAVRDGGLWRITGQKVWTSMAADADWGILLARTNSERPKHDGITCFMLDMSLPGIDVRPLRELTGMAMFNEVFFDDVLVPDDCVVGEVDEGWRAARTTLANERVSMGGGASIVGGAVAIIQMMRDRGIDDDVDALDDLGELVAVGHALGVLGYRLTLEALSGANPSGSEAAVRKLLGTRHDQRVGEVGLGLFETSGLVDEGDSASWVHQYLFNQCLTIAGGTSDIQRNVIAERLLGLPRDP